MEINRINGTLRVRGVRELSEANARMFRNAVCERLTPGLSTIEIDLSQTSLVDSCGLGALISVSKAANDQNRDGVVALRLVNPQPPVQQVFELTRLHRVFEIVVRNGVPSRAELSRPSSSSVHNQREQKVGPL